MNKKFTPYIYTLFFLCFYGGIFGQELSLKLIGKDSIETSIINQIPYQKKHSKKEDLTKEIYSIHERIKRNGFFTSTIEEITNKENEFVAKFNLGKKTEEVVVILSEKSTLNYIKLLTNNDSIRLNTKELEPFITNITLELDKKGASFSKITLEEPLFIEDVLYLKLRIQKSNERKIDKVVLNKYEEFPSSFIKNYFKINSSTVFSKEKIESISTLTKGISFVKEVKPPEVLFKKDSTLIYLFLEKLNANSVDAIVNLTSKEDGSGVLLNGNLDLKLNNVLNSGEQFALFWNRVNQEKSELKLSTRLPYLFNSAFSTLLAFNIYRQDSTFLNTSFNIGVDYQLNPKSTVAISYTSENSNYLLNQASTDITSYSNYFLGIGYQYLIPEKSSFFFRNRLLFNLKPSYGKRRSDINNTNQLKVWLSMYINVPITTRSYLYVKNESGLLESSNYFTNELFRIGGANSIRGFNEQSIFTDKYSFINLEYRYATSTTSYIHTITDIGIYSDPILNNTSNIFGIGVGYLFNINNNLVNLGYVAGHKLGSDFNLKNSKLIVSWRSFF
ncbi:MAG: hypothetical protein JXR05_06675 [Flavobacteriaceae bacterium]